MSSLPCCSGPSASVAPAPLSLLDDYGDTYFVAGDTTAERARDDAQRRRADETDRLAVTWHPWLVREGLTHARLARATEYATMCVHGIPVALRSALWWHASGAAARHVREPNVFAELLSSPTPSPSARQIAVDVPRTHATHPYFAPEATGRASLLRVLTAVALRVPDIGCVEQFRVRWWVDCLRLARAQRFLILGPSHSVAGTCKA